MDRKIALENEIKQLLRSVMPPRGSSATYLVSLSLLSFSAGFAWHLALQRPAPADVAAMFSSSNEPSRAVRVQPISVNLPDIEIVYDPKSQTM